MKKILVIDDDKTVTHALVIKLRKAGYEVQAAYDSLIGVNLAVQWRPDLIVLDIAMPAGGGFFVAERVQNLSTICGTPMIFITGRRDQDSRVQAMGLGAAAVFEKPVDPEVLLSAVRSALGETTPPPAQHS